MWALWPVSYTIFFLSENRLKIRVTRVIFFLILELHFSVPSSVPQSSVTLPRSPEKRTPGIFCSQLLFPSCLQSLSHWLKLLGTCSCPASDTQTAAGMAACRPPGPPPTPNWEWYTLPGKGSEKKRQRRLLSFIVLTWAHHSQLIGMQLVRKELCQRSSGISRADVGPTPSGSWLQCPPAHRWTGIKSLITPGC